MKYTLYSVKDALVGFGAPFIGVNPQATIRAFKIAQTKDDAREDKTLWTVGEFDDETGEIKTKVEMVEMEE